MNPTDGTTSLHWLVRVEPQIEWHGDIQYLERWGEAHPLCNPIDPTDRAVVRATSHGAAVDLHNAWSIPVSPVLNGADSLAEVSFAPGLGAKVRVYTSAQDSD
jgi:hypothetical protein